MSSKLLLVVLLLLPVATIKAQEDSPQTSLNALVDDARARAVVAALDSPTDSQLWSAGDFGDVQPSKAIFEIGSISKVFTSLLAETLVESDDLRWDMTLAETLPAVTFASDKVAAITLLELSTHTSGLPRLPDNMPVPDPLDPFAGYGDEDLLAFLANFDPDILDKTYEYSNLGAGLLGYVAADIAGETFAVATKTRTLDPFDMHCSHVGLNDALSDRLIRGYSDGADMANWSSFDALAGAGAITSCVDDLRKFVRAHFTDNAMTDALAAIQRPQDNGETAYGWHLTTHPDGDTIYWHNGGTGGYASYLSIRPETQTSVILLSASTEYGAVTEIGMRLARGESFLQSDTDLSPYVGVFQLNDGFYLTIFEQDGKLLAQVTGQAAFPLQDAGDDVFTFAAASIEMTFNVVDGSSTSIDYRQPGFNTTAPRVSDDLGVTVLRELETTAEQLADYVGKYQIAPNAVFTMFTRDQQLFAQLTGQQAFPVFRYDDDRFFYKAVDARLFFGRDADGKVISVTLDQGGQQTAPRIND